jgi:hypothetical protein
LLIFSLLPQFVVRAGIACDAVYPVALNIMQDKGVMSFDYAWVATEDMAVVSSALREVAQVSVGALS